MDAWPLSRLELWAAVPLSRGVVEAVAGCCLHRACLCLDLSQSHVPQERQREAGMVAAAERTDGVMQLLEGCGPRLRALRLYARCARLACAVVQLPENVYGTEGAGAGCDKKQPMLNVLPGCPILRWGLEAGAGGANMAGVHAFKLPLKEDRSLG